MRFLQRSLLAVSGALAVVAIQGATPAFAVDPAPTPPVCDRVDGVCDVFADPNVKACAASSTIGDWAQGSNGITTFAAIDADGHHWCPDIAGDPPAVSGNVFIRGFGKSFSDTPCHALGSCQSHTVCVCHYSTIVEVTATTETYYVGVLPAVDVQYYTF